MNFDELKDRVVDMVVQGTYMRVEHSYAGIVRNSELWTVVVDDPMAPDLKHLIHAESSTADGVWRNICAAYEAAKCPPTLRPGTYVEPSCGQNCEDCSSCDSRCADIKILGEK